MSPYKYRAFISYSWSDRIWGEWLHRALETYRTPTSLVGRQTPGGPVPANLHPIFKDREEEAAGHSIGASIEAAMLASEFLIVLCSPRSAQSKWVNREVAFFKRNRDPSKILTVIVDGEPGASAIAGRESEECFPETLLFKVGEDLAPTADAEDAPLAADARETGDGRRGAKLKLAAAILGLGLDDLVRRDEKRRASRRRVVYAGLAALSLVLGGLSIFAFTQRDAAVLARNEAVAAKNAAETAEKDAKFQRDDAQGLIEFMLTDFRKELNSLGRLDVLERTAKRLLESYSKQDIGKLDANALGRRARALLLLGEVDNSRGNLDAALARYEEAAATTAELLARNPGEAQQIFDHAQSVFWVGYIAWQRGDHAAAKKQFTEYHDLAQRLVAIDPDKDEWRMEVKYALNNLGTLAMDEGDAAEAEIAFRKALGLAEELLRQGQGETQRVIDTGNAYAWLADALYRQNKFEEAAAARDAEIQLYGAALGTSKEDAPLLLADAIARYQLAEIHLTRGDTAKAVSDASHAAAAAAKLLAVDPQNALFAERTAVAHTMLAEALHYVGRHADAGDSIAISLQVAERFSRSGANRQEWVGHIAIQSKLLLARFEVRPARAMQLYGSIVSELHEQTKAHGALPIVEGRYAAALAGRARMSSEFRNAWPEIIGLLGAEPAKHGPEALTLLAESYQRTARPNEAKAITVKLFAAGYRHPDFIALLQAYPQLNDNASERH